MTTRPSPRWVVAVAVMVAVLAAVWLWWPNGSRASREVGWQAQTELPLLAGNPRGIAVGRTGDVYVVETGYLQWLSPGRFIPQRLAVPDLKSPYALAIGPAGELYATDYGNERILRIAADRSATVALSLPGSADQGSARTGHSYDAGVAVDRAGTVFTTDPEHARILRLPAGGGVEVVAEVERLRPPIAVSDSGDVVVYVAEPNPTLLTFRAGRGPAVPTAVPGLKFVEALTFDHRGDLLLADNVLEFPPEGDSGPSTTTATLWRLAPGARTPVRLPYTELGTVGGLTVDDSDTIYFTDT
ncbi:hypothetical protein ACW9HQ_38080, partial [Nocardia gipuzkoensis]